MILKNVIKIAFLMNSIIHHSEFTIIKILSLRIFFFHLKKLFYNFLFFEIFICYLGKE